MIPYRANLPDVGYDQVLWHVRLSKDHSADFCLVPEGDVRTAAERSKLTAEVESLGWHVSANRLEAAKANREEFLNFCLAVSILFNDCEALHLFRA